MLSHISWGTYLVTLLITTLMYYAFVLIRYNKYGQKMLFDSREPRNDLIFPAIANRAVEADIMGAAAPGPVQVLDDSSIVFGTPEPDELPDTLSVTRRDQPDVINNLPDMIAETKTLIRVIVDTGESRENFELLFRLIMQKYPDVAGTPYQQKINEFLLSKDRSGFPFELTAADLEKLWTPEIN